MPTFLARAHRVRTLLLGIALAASAAGTAFGQGAGVSGAVSTYLDPSVPSAGMGGATAAAFWTDLNEWSNPALLGYQRGIRYSYSRFQLVPGLADNVHFTAHRLAIGTGGVGISIVGKPVEGLGGMELDYGTTFALDDEGNITTFHAFEEVRQFGIGVNVLELLENIAGPGGSEVSRLSRHLDVSLGHTWKEVLVDLDPAAGGAETTERDWGGLVRVTPIGSLSSSPVTVALSAALSHRNYDDSRIVYDVDPSDPIVEERLVGGAAQIKFNLRGRSGGVWNVLTPSIGVGATWQEARYYEGGVRLGESVETRTGQEINVLGIVSGRHGFVDNDSGTIRGDTWGLSAGLQYRGVFGIRYDWAQVPQAEFLDQEVARRGFTAFFDPFKLLREARGTSYNPF